MLNTQRSFFKHSALTLSLAHSLTHTHKHSCSFARSLLNRGAQKNKTKAFKKKTTFYQNASSETTGDNLKKIRALRKQESLPWIFEDGDGEFNLVGKLQGEQGANYAVLVFENNEFTMVPVTHWYRFQPRITYRTLTTDEAEERLASKNVNLDRWMMHRLKPQTESITQDANLSEIGRQFTATSGNQHNQQKLAADELLYDEEFQDDEEVDQEEEDAMSEDDETAVCWNPLFDSTDTVSCVCLCSSRRRRSCVVMTKI